MPGGGGVDPRVAVFGEYPDLSLRRLAAVDSPSRRVGHGFARAATGFRVSTRQDTGDGLHGLLVAGALRQAFVSQ